MTFCNSRTLPGQPCRAKALRNPGVRPRNCLLCALANIFRKYSARRGMSSALSRSGGMWIRTTETRKYKSSRKVPFCTISSRLRLVAQITRTSMGWEVFEPSRSTLRSCLAVPPREWKKETSALQPGLEPDPPAGRHHPRQISKLAHREAVPGSRLRRAAMPPRLFCGDCPSRTQRLAEPIPARISPSTVRTDQQRRFANPDSAKSHRGSYRPEGQPHDPGHARTPASNSPLELVARSGRTPHLDQPGGCAFEHGFGLAE